MGVFRYLSKRPTGHFVFRFERADGAFRTISVPVGRGRFQRGRVEDAQALAEQRLSEQFGAAAFQLEDRRRDSDHSFVDPAAQLLRDNPDLHQDNYRLVSVERI